MNIQADHSQSEKIKDCRSKRGADGATSDLLCSFAELILEFFAARVSMQCIMKDWDFSILVLIDEQKGLISVPVNNRPLQLILILR